MTQDEAIRKAAAEICQKYLCFPCREVDDAGNICAWYSSSDDGLDVADIIRKHLKEACPNEREE